MLITSTLGIYYLPRIAEIRSSNDLILEMKKIYKFSIPAAVVVALIIYSTRDFIIELLFTPDFTPMRELFAWQLTGDVIKIGAFVFAYIMIGKAMVSLYVFTEIFFSATLYMLTYICVDEFGLKGAAIAYAANYLLYFISMIYIIGKKITAIDN
jgi:PST family polysaccharide transporter